MNKKLEKYFNFILDDLMRDTKFRKYPTSVRVKYPYDERLHSLPPITYPSDNFRNHVRERYGCMDSEIENLWDLYRDRVIDGSLKIHPIFLNPLKMRLNK
jgi:hypothetical protein